MWIEEAATILQVNLVDYAAGGATTGSVPGREQLQSLALCDMPCSSSMGTRLCSRHQPACYQRRICKILLPHTCFRRRTTRAQLFKDATLSISLCAENPPLPKGFAGLTVETLVLAPTLFQQLDMHFLAMNNTLNSSTMYIIFMGK